MEELIFELSPGNRWVVAAAMVANDYSISGRRVADDHQQDHNDENKQNSRHIGPLRFDMRAAYRTHSLSFFLSLPLTTKDEKGKEIRENQTSEEYERLVTRKGGKASPRAF